ncbi:MAG: hypothetical protein Q8P92_00210 [Candidatus Daviesbacteria bacterium]|nr:hypothetical protein [Candidatus Daviesbacteria bacterium]
MEYLSLLPATALGYFTFRATTHPNARIRKRLPNIRIKRLQLFPVIRLNMFGRTLHFHHWMNLSILLALSGVTSLSILDHTFTRGLLFGGIIQGLTLPRGYRNIFPCKCSHCIN